MNWFEKWEKNATGGRRYSVCFLMSHDDSTAAFFLFLFWLLSRSWTLKLFKFWNEKYFLSQLFSSFIVFQFASHYAPPCLSRDWEKFKLFKFYFKIRRCDMNCEFEYKRFRCNDMAQMKLCELWLYSPMDLSVDDMFFAGSYPK